MKLQIIKLGGSIVTHKKSNIPSLHEPHIAALAAELAMAYHADPTQCFIVLHGAGSLGHPQVREHDLLAKPLTSPRLLAASDVIQNMRQLTDAIARQLCRADVPALPLQTSSLFVQQAGILTLQNSLVIEQLIQVRAVPVFGGDLVMTDDGSFAVASADDISVLLAQHFKATRIVFATDVAGVYRAWPVEATDQPVITLDREGLSALVSTLVPTTYDVTGEMRGKLAKLLALSQGSVTICNGIEPGNLRQALANKPIGTTIILDKKK